MQYKDFKRKAQLVTQQVWTEKFYSEAPDNLSEYLITTKINSSVAVGLLRSVYVIKHIVKEDFNRILTYFLEPTEESKNLFIGLDLDYNEF